MGTLPVFFSFQNRQWMAPRGVTILTHSTLFFLSNLLCDQRLNKNAVLMHLRVHNSRSSLNICRQMGLFEMVQTLILRFPNMEKWINSLNLSTPIFRTLQYLEHNYPMQPAIFSNSIKLY